MLTRDSTELTDPRVVPSLADRWSHHTGGPHFKVVPSHWRATQPSSSIRMPCACQIVSWSGSSSGFALVTAPPIRTSRYGR